MKIQTFFCLLLFGWSCLPPHAYAQLQQQVIRLTDSIQTVYVPDKRIAVWEIHTEVRNDTAVICGKTDREEAVEALEKALLHHGFATRCDYRLLPDPQLQPYTWALVNLSVASLCGDSRHSSELVSQATLGTPLRILERCGEFYRVQTPDRYVSYIPESSVRLLTGHELEQWKQSRRYLVTDLQGTLTEQPDGDATRAVSDVVTGCILEYRGEQNGQIRLALPDGREGYLAPEAVCPIETWSRQPFDTEKAERYARSMMGMPYLWGGMSTKAADCSGFVRTIYFANGILLQRDASQQVRYGRKTDPSQWRQQARKGDLIFIGTRPGKVSHVAMYLADGYYIHCSGRVKINSMDPESPDYLDYVFISMSRIEGETDPEGIWNVCDHPWYFSHPN